MKNKSFIAHNWVLSLSLTLATVLITLQNQSYANGLGLTCKQNTECVSPYSCMQKVCTKSCKAKTDCPSNDDGYTTDCKNNICVRDRGLKGAECAPEDECADGLYCKLFLGSQSGSSGVCQPIKK